MKILLVRHGESEGNVDRTVHSKMADHAIPLSERGHQQARRAGEFLGKWFTDNEASIVMSNPLQPLVHVGSGKLPFRLWNSPYLRTRQTANGILTAIKETTGAVPCWGVREHINLAEQQYGLFDGLDDDELTDQYPKEHEHYQKCEAAGGKFWARMPLGESRFDVAVRVHQAFGTFQRDADRHGIDTLVVVAHGTTIRAFVMQWLHLSFEWFEKEPNPKNCSIRLLIGDKDLGYIHEGG
jgi:broad specificity phosphatase PhoE